jgi:hypothetical protein
MTTVELHLRDIARKLLIEHEWDLNAAREGIGTALARDYIRQNIQAYVAEALTTTMGEMWRARRYERYESRVLRPGETSDCSGLTASYRMQYGWYDWELDVATGTRLGDATRPMLRAHVEMWEKQIRTTRVNLEWLRLIEARLADDTTPVRQAVSLALVEELRARAEAMVGDRLSWEPAAETVPPPAAS